MNVLNIGGVSGGAEGNAAVETPEQLGRYLQRAMLQIKADHIGNDGRGVDYSSLASSKSFLEYIQVAGQLVTCDPIPLSEEERMAFFISILQ